MLLVVQVHQVLGLMHPFPMQMQPPVHPPVFQPMFQAGSRCTPKHIHPSMLPVNHAPHVVFIFGKMVLAPILFLMTALKLFQATTWTQPKRTWKMHLHERSGDVSHTSSHIDTASLARVVRDKDPIRMLLFFLPTHLPVEKVEVVTKASRVLATERRTPKTRMAIQATSLPGVHFFGTEVENLRSVSQAGSVVSSGSRKRTTVEDPEPATPNAPTKTVPRWSSGFFPHAGVSSTSLPERLIPGAPEPSSPPPAEPAPTEHTVLLGVRTDQPDQPSTSATVGAEPPTHLTGKAESRMSRDQQERVREQSIQGLQNVLLGIGSQSDQHVSAASNAAASANPTRHVLNLDASITRQTM